MSDDFFKRKIGKGITIPEPGKYDVENEDDCIACGLDKDDFSRRNQLMFNQQEGFEVKKGNNPVAAITSRLEDHFSKREIAFLLAKEMLIGLKEQAVKRQEDGK